MKRKKKKTPPLTGRQRRCFVDDCLRGRRLVSVGRILVENLLLIGHLQTVKLSLRNRTEVVADGDVAVELLQRAVSVLSAGDVPKNAIPLEMA